MRVMRPELAQFAIKGKKDKALEIRVKKIPRPGIHSLGQKRPGPGGEFEFYIGGYAEGVNFGIT